LKQEGVVHTLISFAGQGVATTADAGGNCSQGSLVMRFLVGDGIALEPHARATRR
jgi:hypothetical protein